MPYIDHPLTKWVEEYTVEDKSPTGWVWMLTTQDEDEVRRYLDRMAVEQPTAQIRTRTRRIPNPYYGRFQVGTRVKVAAWSDAFMMGVTSGRVVKVGRKHVHVRWSMNPGVVLKFPPEHLLPETEWED